MVPCVPVVIWPSADGSVGSGCVVPVVPVVSVEEVVVVSPFEVVVPDAFCDEVVVWKVTVFSAEVAVYSTPSAVFRPSKST